jgi:hypothetical protein
MSYRASHYGMILPDPVPTLLRAYGAPVVFRSHQDILDYARLHCVQR